MRISDFKSLRVLRAPSSVCPFTLLATLAVLLVATPPLIFGPWLPFHDLLAFAGLDACPARQSYGPLHYTPLQFTYVLHLLIARFLGAFGVHAAGLVVCFYLLQLALFLYILGSLLRRLLTSPWAGGLALLLGALAIWDGQFLWGGPLPFSLACGLLSLAGLQTTGEVVGSAKPRQARFAVLCLAAIVSHPFALPFALLLTLHRWGLVQRARATTLFAGALIALFGVVVMRDSPDRDQVSSAISRAVHGVSWSQLSGRLSALFSGDAIVADYLFGTTPLSLKVYFCALGVIKLSAFASAPVVSVVAKERAELRAVAVLVTAVGLIYFCTPQLSEILPWWPERILSVFNPFVFACGIVGPAYLLGRWTASPQKVRTPKPTAIAIGAVSLSALLLSFQIPILRHSESIGRSFVQLREDLLKSGSNQAMVVLADLENVRPFFLRGATFLLFSDPEVIARSVLIHTEWHIQDRHPTRLTERYFYLNRTQYVGSVSLEGDRLRLRVSPAPTELAVPTNNNRLSNQQVGQLETQEANRLYQAGLIAAAAFHYRAAIQLDPQNADAVHNFGIMCAHLGRNDDAITFLDAATRMRPNNADGFANLGNVLLKVGRVQEAVSAFESALRIDPNHRSAAEARTNINGTPRMP